LPESLAGGPRGQPAVDFKVNHFLPFGKDGPGPGQFGAGVPQGEPQRSDVRGGKIYSKIKKIIP
jgi:hypothetical protein